MDSSRMGLRERLSRSRLYLVTPAFPPGGLAEFLPRVLEAGVDLVQLRDKHLEAGPLLDQAEVVRRRTTEFGALFLVNDRVDLAIASGADGVHVGQHDLTPAQARRQLGAQPLIGLSTHTLPEVVAGGSSGADYLAVGPVYATPTKPGRPAVGLDLVTSAARAALLPLFAIGGIDQAVLADVLAAGARRIAVVRALTQAADPAAAARALTAALRDIPS